MGLGYKAITWNKFKKQYDLFLLAGILTYLVLFIGTNLILFPYHNPVTILIRATGTLAILMLHIILIIGPLCRLNSKFLPLLYNRRHFGVSMFFIASLHAILSLQWFHGNANVNPWVSLFASNTHYDSFFRFPFQTLGFAAWVILLLMAFTSHDYWLHFFTPRVWKSLHMLVYLAYALLVLHVVLGVIQLEHSPIIELLLFVGLCAVILLHVAAALKTNRTNRHGAFGDEEGWKYVGRISEIEENAAKLVVVGGESIAVFKYEGKLSAVHNACKHQMGPLSEGKIINSCITCPWHGYQYQPQDGCSPPPFTEKVHTYNLRLKGDQIFVNPIPLPEGSFVEPLLINSHQAQSQTSSLFIGWDDTAHNLLKKPAFRFALISISCLAILAVVFSVNQRKISKFKIDYDQTKQVVGLLSGGPVPSLRITSGVDSLGHPVFRTILLVDGYKHGATALVQNALSKLGTNYVRIEGYATNFKYVTCGPPDAQTPICGGEGAKVFNYPIMEVANGLSSITAAGVPIPQPSRIPLTGKDINVKGWIIDPKCYYGAMNPGEGKPHRSCAIRCISGGIMPCLKYELNGKKHIAVLVGKAGEAINEKVLSFVDDQVVVKGNIRQMDNWEIISVTTLEKADCSK